MLQLLHVLDAFSIVNDSTDAPGTTGNGHSYFGMTYRGH
jgi:hypothetical protein